MRSRWVQAEADRFADRYAASWGDVLAVRAYSARLLGADPSLVLHGGGNTSVKDLHTTIVGERRQALYVKASGADMAAIEPDAYLALDLDQLRKLRVLDSIDDPTMARELRALMFAVEGSPDAGGHRRRGSTVAAGHRCQGSSDSAGLQPCAAADTLN